MKNVSFSSNYANGSVDVKRKGRIDQIVSISPELSNAYPIEIIGYRFRWKWFENDPADRLIGKDKANKLVGKEAVDAGVLTVNRMIALRNDRICSIRSGGLVQSMKEEVDK